MSRDVSMIFIFIYDLFIVFLRSGINVPSFIIVGYLWQILGGGGVNFSPPPPQSVSSPKKVNPE